MAQPTLIYVGDPMCSWCYGFAPQLRALYGALADRLALHIIVGGLRPYHSAAMNEDLKAHLRHHWNEVALRSGQPFDYALFNRSDFVYDTEPACRAVVAARMLRPECALPLFFALQDAFYRDGRDITATATLTEVAAAIGLDTADFAAILASDAARQATRHNFITAHNLGVRGFPTLLLQREQRYWLVCSGYAEAGPLSAAIEQALGD